MSHLAMNGSEPALAVEVLVLDSIAVVADINDEERLLVGVLALNAADALLEAGSGRHENESIFVREVKALPRHIEGAKHEGCRVGKVVVVLVGKARKEGELPVHGGIFLKEEVLDRRDVRVKAEQGQRATPLSHH